VPDTSIIDRRLAALAANPPAPEPAWKFQCHFWASPAESPTVTFACTAPAEADRPTRARADGPEKLAAEVLDAAKKLPALEKVADYEARIAAVNDRKAAAQRAIQTAEARETILRNDPPADGLAEALRAAADARKAGTDALSATWEELRVLEPLLHRHRAEAVNAMLPLADEAAGRLRAEVAAEEERLLAEVEAFARARAERIVHLKAVAALLDGNAEWAAAKAAERAVLGDRDTTAADPVATPRPAGYRRGPAAPLLKSGSH
jgi:hypothetical protein